MQKVGTAGARQSSNISQQKLTVKLDLVDRNSWYWVLDEASQMRLEQRVRYIAPSVRFYAKHRSVQSPADLATIRARTGLWCKTIPLRGGLPAGMALIRSFDAGFKKPTFCGLPQKVGHLGFFDVWDDAQRFQNYMTTNTAMRTPG